MGPVRLSSGCDGHVGWALPVTLGAVLVIVARMEAQVPEPVPDVRLVLANPLPGDVMGAAVAGFGELAAVGVRGEDWPAPNCGGVVLYRRVAGSFESTSMQAPGLLADDEFGTAVALSSRWLVGGAPRRGPSGATFVSALVGGSVAPALELRDPSAATGARFGASLAVIGDWIAVGAPGDGVDGLGNAGSARIFRRSGGAWVAGERLLPPVPVAGARFGSSVGASESWIAVGAPGAEGGTVYLFRVNGESIEFDEAVLPPGVQMGGWFGSSIALRGGRMVVGCPYANDSGPHAGLAIEYDLDQPTAALVRILRPSAPSPGGNFGHSVAIGQAGIIVGAPGWQRNGVRTGCADVFLPTGTDAVARIVPPPDAGLCLAGSDVAFAAELALTGMPGCNGSRGEVAALDMGRDCNENGIPDAADVASGTSQDSDGNGVPDSCDCPADLDGNGAVDGVDLGVLLAAWGVTATGSLGDLDRDGFVDGADLGLFLAAWGPCG